MPGLVRDLITSAIERKRYKKALEEFLKAFPEQEQPFAGKKISELAAVLGGVGKAMPLGEGAIPKAYYDPASTGLAPSLSQTQKQQLIPPSVINPQNAQIAKAKAIMRSGMPGAAEMGMKMLMPEEKPEEWARASDTFIFNKADGSIREIPAKDLVLKPDDVVMRPGPDGKFVEVARGLPKPVTPAKPKFVAAETSPGVYSLVEESFAVENGLTVRRDKGITVGYDAEGRPTVQIGGVPSIAGTAGKKVEGDIETLMFDAEKGLLRMENILGNFDESFLTAPTQIKNWGRDKWEKLGLPLSETGKESLSKYTTFETYVLDNLNRYIKEITGAQMGENEADRLMKAMPSMEQGPTKFMARSQAIKSALRASHDAYFAARKKGMTHEQALSEADRASFDAFYRVDGGGYQAGPAPENLPAPPSGYKWVQAPDGVYELQGAD